MSLTRPRTFEAVVEAVVHHGARIIAGGTALQPMMNASYRGPAELVSLSDLPEAWTLGEPAPGRLRVGAMVPVSRLERCGLAPRWFATPAVRRRATLVGNLVHTAGLQELEPLVTACRGELHWLGPEGSGCGPVGDPPSGVVATAVEMEIPEVLIHRRSAVRATLARPRCAVTLAVTGADLRVVTSGTGMTTTVVPGVERGMATEEYVDAVVGAAGGPEPGLLAVVARRAHDEYRRASCSRAG